MLYCELPHTDLQYSMGFPIHRESPPELHNSVGLTFPPRAGVLVPKTHTFSCNTYLLAWFSLMALVVKIIQSYHKSFFVSLSQISLAHCVSHRSIRTPQLTRFSSHTKLENYGVGISVCQANSSIFLY